MADRYWVGGTGTWNISSTTNWSTSSGGSSGASVPTAADSVFFDQAATYTVTLTGALTCLNHTVSAGTVTFTSTGTIAVNGSMSLVAATVWNATGTITFNSTTTGNTITTNAVVISCATTFNGVGGAWQLQSALTSGATRTCNLANGTLDLNGYTLTTGLFSSNNSNIRAIAFGTGKIVLTATTGTVVSMSAATNFTYTGTSRIEVTASGAGRTITPTSTNAVESNALSIYVTTGSDTVTVSGNARFLNFDLTGFGGTLTYTGSSRYFGNLVFSSGMTVGLISGGFTFAKTSGTQTITTEAKTIDQAVTIDGVGGTVFLQDALTLGSTQPLTITNGTLKLKAGTTNTVGSLVTSGTNGKYLLSTILGTAATISDASGTNTVQYLTVQDSIATGGAVFDALAITNVDAGDNTGWLFNTAPSIGNEITMRLRSFTQPRRF